jgi:uncharacterized protein (DUF924 family)
VIGNDPSPGAVPGTILAFWRQAGPAKWFCKNDAFDAEIKTRFFTVYAAAAAGQLTEWEATAETALALVIVLDQFPRNIFRGSARAFAADALARAVTDRALVRGFDQQVPAGEQQFFYLPFEHSENLTDQERSLALFRTTGNADLLKWAEKHADIIRHFGRFPHRNVALGRASTAEEKAFLDADGFAG